jgi:hypothetical protein
MCPRLLRNGYYCELGNKSLIDARHVTSHKLIMDMGQLVGEAEVNRTASAHLSAGYRINKNSLPLTVSHEYTPSTMVRATEEEVLSADSAAIPNSRELAFWATL